jgi:hypothetical protein
MKRADEELCKMQFDAFLRRFFAPSEVSWIEVAQQDEPPDYYLLLGNARFAVEVTTLLEKVPVGSGSPLPPAVISKILRDFVEEVEATAKAEGCLHGDYLVTFPTPIDDLTDVRSEIQGRLLDHIRSTGSLDSSSLEIVFERTVLQQRRQQCGIQKVGNRLDRVVSGEPVWAKWEGDATVDLCGLLNKSLDTKVNKLRDITVPKILLLLDEYVFADQDMYERCVPRISSLGSFHTVFVVQGNKRGFVFCSQRSDWSQQCSL